MHTFSVKERILSRLNLLPLPIYDVFAAPLLGHVLSVATRLNMFELLREPRSSEALAREAHIHPDASAAVLSSLAEAGYARKTANGYTLSPSASKWFLKSSPSYLGNFVRYVEILYSRWLHLGETIKNGEPPVSYLKSFGEKEWEIYILGMMDLAKIFMPYVLPKLQLPQNARRVLDLGGSHGLYSIEMCRRYPQLRATVVDFPHVLKFTKKIVEEHGATDRIEFEAADVLEKKYGAGLFDGALAFNIVHGLRPEETAHFLRDIAKTLKPGGRLYILDQLETGKGSDMERFIPLMVGINVMNEVGGRTYSVEELGKYSKAAGFGAMHVWRLRLPGLALMRLELTRPAGVS